LGKSVQLVFLITQHSRDAQLMNSLVSYFGCGRYVLRKNKDFGEYVITKFSDLTEKVIPFFDKYKIIGVKALDFADFCKVHELVKNKAHLTPEGLELIEKIKSGMNKGRK